MTVHTSPRLAAVQVLTHVLHAGQSLTMALAENRLPTSNSSDKALIQALCFGVLRYYERLTWIKDQRLKKPLAKSDQDIDTVLLLGLYQLIYMRMAQYASVSETVELTRLLNKPWASKLVNAILRGFLRDGEPSEDELPTSARYCQPPWLLDKLRQHYPDAWQDICVAAMQQPPMSLRVNARNQSRAAYLATLAEHKIEATPLAYSKVGVMLEKPMPAMELPGFTQGDISVQDESGQLAATLLDLRPGLRILDACSAPGSKLMHILESEAQLKACVALDIDEERLEKIKGNLERIQVQATLVQGDASLPQQWWDGQPFDRILLDAPCSATGVIRRHPDIKRLRRASDIAKLAQTQVTLFRALWPLIKPGGRLVYATCSILPEENDHIIGLCSQQHSDMQVQPIQANWGVVTRYGRQILPEPHGMDGFYYAVIDKRNN